MIQRILSILFIGTILISACTAQSSAIPSTPAAPSAPPPTATNTLLPPTATPVEIVPTYTNAPTLTDTPIPQPVDRLLGSFGRHWATRLIASNQPQGVFIAFGNRLCFYPQPDLNEDWCIWVDRSARGYAWALAVNPRKPMLAMGLANGKVAFVNVNTRAVEQVIQAAPDNIRSLAWSPDGESLATGTDDIAVKVWNIQTGKVIEQFQGDQSSVLFLAWSPDGKLLAGGTFFGSVFLWNIESKQQQAVWKAPDGDAISGLLWTADSQLLYAGAAYALGCGEGCNPVWDGLVVSLYANTLAEFSEWDAGNPVQSMARKPNDLAIAVALLDGSVRLLSADLSRTLAETSHAWSEGGLAWLDDQEMVFLRQGNLDSGQPAGGNFPASSAPDRLVRWQPPSGEVSEYPFPGGGSVSMPAWSPDGKILAMGTPNGEILLWNLQENALLLTLKVSDSFSPAAWSPDGRFLAGQDDTGDILLFNTQTWKLEKQISGDDVLSQRLLWSPAGKWIAAASGGNVRIWDVQSGKQVFRVTADSAHSVAWSPDGEYLAVSGGENGSVITIWESSTGQWVKEIKVSGWVTGLNWSSLHSGSLMAITQGGWGEVWNIDTGKMVLQISAQTAGHSWGIEQTALSPDGRVFATASAEILLWDTISGELLERLEGHTDTVIDLSFSPDGKRLASASHEGVVLVWDIK